MVITRFSDLWWRHGWSKGGTTITRARDEKRRIGNTVLSAGMCKSVNTNFIQKKVVFAEYREPTRRSDSSNLKTKDIKIQSVRWVGCIHGYLVPVESGGALSHGT